jgi:hypothetical protein
MKRAIWMIAVLALLLGGVGQARAGILPTHAAAQAYPNWGPDASLVGNGALDTGLLTGVINSQSSNTAEASTTPSQLFLLHAYAHSELYVAGGNAAWRDVAFWNNANHPAALRLNFLVDGSLALTPGFGLPNDSASVSVTTSTDPTDAFQNLGRFDFLTGLDPPRAALTMQEFGRTLEPVFSESGWDSYTFDGSSFTGTFHIITPYDPNLGGYGWAVTLSAVAGTSFGNGTSDFGRTASLQSVTLPYGTPVSGVTFDSGLTFGPATAVPEPASLALLGIGSLGLLGYGWRRRKQVAA